MSDVLLNSTQISQLSGIEKYLGHSLIYQGVADDETHRHPIYRYGVKNRPDICVETYDAGINGTIGSVLKIYGSDMVQIHHGVHFKPVAGTHTEHCVIYPDGSAKYSTITNGVSYPPDEAQQGFLKHATRDQHYFHKLVTANDIKVRVGYRAIASTLVTSAMQEARQATTLLNES